MTTTAPAKKATAANGTEPSARTSTEFRVMTANIQSFPPDALTLDEALEDLRDNAAVADIVLLQEIAPQYRPLVAKAFPETDWEVFFGAPDNSEPIAYRRDRFVELDAKATVLHPPVAKVHFRRHITHLHLRDKPSGITFHVTNLHMVAGAFAKPPHANRALRVREWHAGIGKHRTLVDALASTGEPVIGGGDYNRRLTADPGVGLEIDEKPVKYAVDGKSIDLLWCLDGDSLHWNLLERKVFPGSKGKRPERHSDHAARLARVQLTDEGRTGVPFFVPGTSKKPKRPADAVAGLDRLVQPVAEVHQVPELQAAQRAQADRACPQVGHHRHAHVRHRVRHRHQRRRRVAFRGCRRTCLPQHRGNRFAGEQQLRVEEQPDLHGARPGAPFAARGRDAASRVGRNELQGGHEPLQEVLHAGGADAAHHGGLRIGRREQRERDARLQPGRLRDPCRPARARAERGPCCTAVRWAGRLAAHFA